MRLSNVPATTLPDSRKTHQRGLYVNKREIKASSLGFDPNIWFKPDRYDLISVGGKLI